MRLLLFLLLAATVVAVCAPAATADRVYHSQHLPLVTADSSRIPSGFVENVHPNGSEIYAHEIYSLRGALPGTTYQVFLLVHLGDPECDSVEATNFGSTDLTTNAAGNGTADRFIDSAPEAVRHQTHGVRWEVTLDGMLVFETECTAVTLD